MKNDTQQKVFKKKHEIHVEPILYKAIFKINAPCFQ